MRNRTTTAALVGACLLATAACGPGTEDPGARDITPGELARRIEAGDAPIILDVRTAKEFAAGHIPGAVNVPHTVLAARLAALEWSPSAEIVVHCERERRAADAEKILAEAGFTNARDLTGHLATWRAAGHPVQ